MRERDFLLVFKWRPCEGGEVEAIEDLDVGLFGRNQRAEAVVRVANFLVHRRPVDELQCLPEVAVTFAFALASEFACRLAERLQERVIDFAIDELRRAGSAR